MALSGPKCPMLSRLDLYYEEATIEGTVGQDEGVSTIVTVGKALKQFGVCCEQDWPYLQEKAKDAPTDQVSKDALANRINGYKRLVGLDQIKQYIAFHQQPVLIGMQVFKSMMSET